MIKKRSFIRFLVLVGLLGYLPGLILSLFVNFGYGWLIRYSGSDDYLVSLRNNDALGCQTMKDRSPSLLIIGDSHAYSGVDYKRLQDLLPGERISVCTMAGLAVESLALIISALEQNKIKPAKIVLLTSPYQFIDHSIKALRLQQHAKILASVDKGTVQKSQQVLRYLSGQPIFGKTAKLEWDRFRRHKGHIAQLMAQKVDQRMEVTRSLRKNEVLFLDAPVAKAAQPAIARFCQWIKKQGITLTSVHVPESLYMVRRRGDISWYKAQLKSLSACGHMVYEEGQKYGIDARHFVNRNFVDSHDYSVWEEASDNNLERAFDPDHMNPLGAYLFAAGLAEILR